MKKFILGLIFGVTLTAATTVFASETLRVNLFPAKIEINGQTKELPNEYNVLNYNGHAYVPVRFIAESFGLGVRYINSIESGKVISIMNEPKDVDETTKKVWLIQYRLNIGDTQDDVRTLLGNPWSDRTNDDHQQALWGYNIALEPGYVYKDQTWIDIKGLEQGKIGAQLYIYWTDAGKIDKIELWYKDTKSGKIVTHYVLPDGSTAGAIYE